MAEKELSSKEKEELDNTVTNSLLYGAVGAITGGIKGNREFNASIKEMGRDYAAHNVIILPEVMDSDLRNHIIDFPGIFNKRSLNTFPANAQLSPREAFLNAAVRDNKQLGVVEYTLRPDHIDDAVRNVMNMIPMKTRVMDRIKSIGKPAAKAALTGFAAPLIAYIVQKGIIENFKNKREESTAKQIAKAALDNYVDEIAQEMDKEASENALNNITGNIIANDLLSKYGTV